MTIVWAPSWSAGAPTGPEGRRALTRLQAAVIDSILAGEPGSERERIRLTGIAPRTYQAARRRALEAEWIAERFVPDPTLFGQARVSFVLARPNSVDAAATIKRWTQIERLVLLWKTSTMFFGVFSGQQQDRETPIARELAVPGRYTRAFLLELNLKSPTLPVYFDFEGEWARVVGIPGTSFYPRQLPRHPRGSARAAINPRWKEIVLGLARVTAPAGPDAGRAGIFSRIGVRASLARALRTGWIDRRAFLDPASIPAYEEWTLGQVVFIHGRMREGRRPETLLRTLFTSCAVQPFLFATSGGDVLIASLSPVPPGGVGARRGISVSGTLARFLERVEIDRLPAEELETVVSHRTDLFATT